MLHALSLSVVLYALWLLLSGYFDPLLLSLGLASVFVAVFIAMRMDAVDRQRYPISLNWRALAYWPWLAVEIMKANLEVALVVIKPSLPTAPSVFRVKASQASKLGRVIYANSITLTPGTVTLALRGEYLEVHALTKAAKKGVISGDMDRRVRAIESRAAAGGGQ